MRKKGKGNWVTVIPILVLSLLAVGFLLGSGYAKDCPESEKEIELEKTIITETPEGVESTQPQVTFPHLNHAMEYGCAACHHQWEPDTEASPAKCFECHSNTKERTGEDSYFAAFHDRQAETSCLGCHMTTSRDEDSSSGPLKCNECHIRD